MTISTTSSQATYLGNSSVTVFQFSFIAGLSSNINVIFNDSDGTQTLLSPSQYTVFLNPPATGSLWGVGGTITYPTSGPAIANGTSITIQRVVPLTQQTSISNQGDFYPQVVERALDTLCLEIQQVSGRTGQMRGGWATGITYNFGDVVQDGANGANTQNYYMCAISNVSGVWSTDLAAGKWSLVIDVQTIAGYATDAAASAAAAAVSAGQAASSASTATTQAGIATTQAGIATTQAGIATTQATNASNSATAAAGSATSASTSATNASNSATAAAGSATSASNSATAASGSATAAAGSATSASTSATNASNSATAAAASAVLAASTLTATSTSTNTIGTGSKTFTVQANKQFQTGQFVEAVDQANNTNFMFGQVTSYSGTTLIIDSQSVSGTGTISSWFISVAGPQGPSGSGNVSSVSMQGDNVVYNTAVTGSPITSSGTLIPTLKTQTANTLFAGPATGSAATPTFRAMVTDDIPNTSVTAAKMNAGAATAGQVPIATGVAGAVAYGSIPADYVRIFTQTVSSPVATIDLMDGVNGFVMNGSYSQYIFRLSDIVFATPFSNMNLRTSSNGSFYDNGGTDYEGALALFSAGSPPSNSGTGTPDNKIQFTAFSINGLSSQQCEIYVTLSGVTDSTRWHVMDISSSYIGNTGTLQSYWMGGTATRRDASVIKGIQFYPASAVNITSAKIDVYGVK